MLTRLAKGMALAVGLCVLLDTLAYTADQTILGKSFLIKDPVPGVDATKRKIVVLGKEPTPDDNVLGDPTVGGADIQISANGVDIASQLFTMPASGWKRLPADVANPLVGYKYVDPTPGALGPVKTALIKKPPNAGPFILKAVILGANGPGAQPHITLLPPAPGTDAVVIFTIGGSERYCMTFGGSSGGKVVNTPSTTQDKVFKIVATNASPTNEEGCARPAIPCSGTFVTKWGSEGSGDGQFIFPSGVAVDGSGNVYVADLDNDRIQKFTSSGTFLTKWGSVGSGDGQFILPEGIAVDGSGNVYVADRGNDRIQKFTDSGAFLTKWGNTGSGEGQFSVPAGVAVDGGGNVYVADGNNNNRIQKFTSSGTFLTKWGSFGSGDGQFDSPEGVAVDGSGNVYVADPGNRRIQKFTSSGTFLTKWGSVGSGDGQFAGAVDVALDGSGNVYVADLLNFRIQKFTSSGTFLTKWGSEGSGDGQFEGPRGVAVDGSDHVYVADPDFLFSLGGKHRIQKFLCP